MESNGIEIWCGHIICLPVDFGRNRVRKLTITNKEIRRNFAIMIKAFNVFNNQFFFCGASTRSRVMADAYLAFFFFRPLYLFSFNTGMSIFLLRLDNNSTEEKAENVKLFPCRHTYF
jgi:hypothetical protein